MEPSVSQNGDKIAFISFRSGDCDIWWMDYDGNNEEQLTFNSYFEGGACWSPNGEYIAYAANNDGNFDIWILPVAGGLPMQFTTHTAADMYPSWSPDGISDRFYINAAVETMISGRKRLILLIQTSKNLKVPDVKVYPNPFHKSVNIEYDVHHNSMVILSISNFSGEKIRTLVCTYQNAGKHSVIWDGKDVFGKVVPVGVYYSRILYGGTFQSTKILFLK